MTLLRQDPLTQLAFAAQENKGVFALLLGSGLSRSAQIPTGWEITIDLVRRIGLAQGSTEQADWAQWYRTTTGLEPNYSTLLEDLAGTPEERRAILHRYIEPSEEDREEGRKVPTAAHRAIAQLVRSGHIRVIVTTNFDRLMENALREQGVEPTVVASVDMLAGAEPLTHSRCYLLKLHGDYKDARILNTDEELGAYPEAYNRLLDRIFDEHGLIVSGWSGEWDHALRSAILRAPNRRYPVYWCTRGTPGNGAAELIAHRNARSVSTAGADEFFNALLQRIQTLEQAQRPNPLSVDLLVASAKRYLARPEHRIQLDELIAEETERLLSQLEDPAFFVSGQWSQEGFRSRVVKYESSAEPLARMAGVLGRWGDSSELPLILDVLRSLYSHGNAVQNGLTIWLNLRSYPCVLVFTAYCLGLTRAGRWKTAHQLFSAQLAVEHREPVRLVEALLPNGWRGNDQSLWQQLEGLDRRKTPLSDHLVDVMTDWRKSFGGVDAGFELLFERFELLGALACFDQHDEAKLEALAASNSHQQFAWAAIGRAGWHSASARILIQELESDTRAIELLDAGFGKGSRRMIQLFIQNFHLIASRMTW
ncbi:SIR2 family protein [Roseateles sp.]|uniref:SIR2 family protein n=1 Tax=Roseateles sp. TaxID=1971397 RepID=UPI003BA492E1